MCTTWMWHSSYWRFIFWHHHAVKVRWDILWQFVTFIQSSRASCCSSISQSYLLPARVEAEWMWASAEQLNKFYKFHCCNLMVFVYCWRRSHIYLVCFLWLLKFHVPMSVQDITWTQTSEVHIIHFHKEEEAFGLRTIIMLRTKYRTSTIRSGVLD